MKSLFGGSKKPTASATPSDDAKPTGIKVVRSDGAGHDLNTILASADIAELISNSGRSDSSSSQLETVHEEDHGKISLTRSDGVNHCIINVFKGISDSKGETMKKRTPLFPSKNEHNSNNINVPHALSMSAISNLRTNGIMFPLSVRIVHMSDTSNFLSASQPNHFLPKGDILVHSGNFTIYGAKKEFEQFNSWLGSVMNEYKFRIVTLGCRDVKEFGNNWDVMRRLLSNATHVLCYEPCVVLGIRFYGSPWHWGHHKNYIVRKGAPASTSGRFDEIPENTQVLVTHGAAAGILDSANLPGSKELADAIKKFKPSLHLHGHSKGAHGVVSAFGKYPLVVNSALCDPDCRVMYACPHVIKATQISATDEAAGLSSAAAWSFSIDSLMA